MGIFPTLVLIVMLPLLGGEFPHPLALGDQGRWCTRSLVLGIA